MPPRNESSVARAAEQEGHASMDGSISVLIVEDDQGIAALMRGIFEDEGFQVRCALTGEQGLILLASEEPDVIVLDLMLPGISGMTFLERIRAEGRRIPVVITSALRGAAQLAEEAGVVFVAKPFDVEHLLRAVRSVPAQT